MRKSKGGKDWLQPGTREFELRQSRNRHNACFGGVSMAHVWMVVVQERATTTPRAKRLARQVENILRDLKEELKTRIDPATTKENQA